MLDFISAFDTLGEKHSYLFLQSYPWFLFIFSVRVEFDKQISHQSRKN